ncbi:glycosyltransferase family 4 protein [Cyclobacterium xiamenense]|jgi:glycosyltransferase involved in cell wall biosynthesis|uniref:glycosyltransferase family 4 protein n=1 Tax=Cyclobacterium xiamenense TaxID=1297121 RepID=UPI0012B8D052|nr:glycosyltransferase family 1 protein [Cyclobacterium xiamenense]
MKSRPKIVLVDVFYLHLAQTGIKTYTDSLLGQIASYLGSDFHFIVYPSPEKIRKGTFFKGKTPRWKNWLFQGRYFLHKLVVLPWQSIRFRADLVFCPDILPPLWSKGRRVVVIHDAFFWESPEHYHPLWRKIYLCFLEAGIQRGARVLTVSEYARNRIELFLKTPEPITAIPTGLDAGPRQESGTEISPVDSPYFLHVGVMEHRKNLVTLVQAFAVFVRDYGQHFRLVLVGARGPRPTLDAYDGVLQEIDRLDLAGKVLLPGYLSKSDLNRYFRFALAYVFPSKNEGFGLPVLEAFSVDLPVIIGPQGALKEVGGSGVLVSDSYAPEDFAAAMGRLANDPALRSKLASLGRERLQAFTGEKFFLSLQTYFTKLLHGD